MIDEENKVLVPWECLTGSGFFTVTIFALGETSEEKLITTNSVDVPVLDSGIASEQNPADPTVGVFQDSVRVVVEKTAIAEAKAEEASAFATASSESAIASAESASESENKAREASTYATASAESEQNARESELKAEQYSLQAMWASNIVVRDGMLCVKVYENEVSNNE